jgi:class 3 adenylate cyclase
VYSSARLEDASRSSTPLNLTLVVAATFFAMAMTFFLYDWFVRRRNDIVVDAATQSSAIVSSLFPSNVKSRLYEARKLHKNEQSQSQFSSVHVDSFMTRKVLRRRSFHSDGGLDHQQSYAALESDTELVDNVYLYKSDPIADYYPETTVLFADIAGFTAWSSTRQPSHVFTLLETIYKAFDDIALRRHVYKVETVGDCYVAVTGLPDLRKDHAVIMARFARECMWRLQQVLGKLEITLGPDTAELRLRVGIHSGPVTAGVLRGARSRFQLFGDTMNTASRMESTGIRGKIQISEESAHLLEAAGKGAWITPRDGTVFAKGKGELKSFWLFHRIEQQQPEAYRSLIGSSNFKLEASFAMKKNERSGSFPLSQEVCRLVEWNYEMLRYFLKLIVLSRVDATEAQARTVQSLSFLTCKSFLEDEVTSVENIKPLDSSIVMEKDIRSVHDFRLQGSTDSELREYVTSIALMYAEHPYHNFEHASFVAFSTVKLLHRIVALKHENNAKLQTNLGSMVEPPSNQVSLDIMNDPTLSFACVFSALIQDCAHPGVSKSQPYNNKVNDATQPNNQSVADLHSVDMAWRLLLDEKFTSLRMSIASTQDELNRFRELVVSLVLASDISESFPTRLSTVRREASFPCSTPTVTDRQCQKVAVATYLMQASAIAHTMQHWHVFRKWNHRLFSEVYRAYVDGPSDDDPAETWYQNEITFFDNHVLPLARKLKECNVVGVMKNEYLEYATRNRDEWEIRGQAFVMEMTETMKAQIELCV